MLPPVGHHEEQLGARLDALARMKEGLPEPHAERRSARLPRRQDGVPTGPQPVGGSVQLGRFPAALDPLERHEMPADHDFGFLHAAGLSVPEQSGTPFVY